MTNSKRSTYKSGVRTGRVAKERDRLGAAWSRLTVLLESFEPHIYSDDCDFRSGFFHMPNGGPMTREALAKKLEVIARTATRAAVVARRGADAEAFASWVEAARK